MTKIFTKFGDAGLTHVCGGAVVSKTDIVVELYGVLDELNCFLGLAKESLRHNNKFTEVFQQIERIQDQLLFFPTVIFLEKPEAQKTISCLTEALENGIDLFSLKLPPLNSFILPGGNEIAARLHVARAVCRRSERVLFHYLLEYESDLNAKEFAKYLNRLSDWLYIAARFVV